MSRFLIQLAIVGSLFGSSHAFIPVSSVPSASRSSSATVPVKMMDAEAIQEMETARYAFWMCFYGAAGVGSIGRELIPIVFGRYTSTKSLGGADTTTRDDEVLGIWGYPEKIYKRDVESILKNSKSLEQIARKYPIEKEEGAEERYKYTHIEVVPSLSYEGFVRANPRANPVALRAVFDSFSNSIGGSNTVSPIVGQQKLDIYLNDINAIASKLNGGKLLGITAFLLVLVLLGIADWLAIYHIWRGWFPEWQGFSNMPASLFDAEIGLRALPDYFME